MNIYSIKVFLTLKRFNTLPADVMFVDKEVRVKYFTQGKERIFAKTGSVIGRHVTNCHPV